METLSKDTIISNGIKYEFRVHANFVLPCSECGAYTCASNEIYLWFEQNDERQTIVFDDVILHELSTIVFSIKQDEQTYALLPKYFKDWNECIGWEDCDDLDGYILDFVEFNCFLQFAYQNNLSNESKSVFESILKHIEKAKLCSKQLRIAKQ